MVVVWLVVAAPATRGIDCGLESCSSCYQSCRTGNGNSCCVPGTVACGQSFQTRCGGSLCSEGQRCCTQFDCVNGGCLFDFSTSPPAGTCCTPSDQTHNCGGT